MKALHCVVSLCISLILVHVVVEAATQPDVISLELDRIGSVGAQLSWNGTTSETYVISYCKLPQCNSYIQSPSLTTASYTLSGLRSLSNYSVFVIATNEHGSTDGNRMNFTTLLENALYFMDNFVNPKGKRYFASGSIFRGPNTYIGYRVLQYFCVPDSSTDTIEWYTPNGGLIPKGSTSSFYHTINTATGESTLQLGFYVSVENEGRNFTCRINSSGFIQDHYFGLYYLLPGEVTGTNYVGDRIYTKNIPPIVREFVLQRGSFDIDTDELHEIRALFEPAVLNWKFDPALIQPNPPDDSTAILTNVEFNSSAICQLGASRFQPQFFCISNKPFILRTTPSMNTGGILFSQASCIVNNSTAYVYTIGDGVNIGVTCPLFYNASFLDTSDLIQLDYQLNRNHSRTLWVDPRKTFAMVKHDREYVCEDKYGTRASFKARVDGNFPIQVFGNDSTITPTSNDTMYIVNEVTLYCLSDSDSSGVMWYSDTNANSTLPRTYTPVSISVTAQPYVSNPRNGRSDLVVRSDPTSYLEGYYYCEDSLNRVMFYSIFTQQPVAPIAQINSNATTLQIYIGIDSLNITCGYSNLAHPAPLSYWEGTLTNTIYTNQLGATDSGNYRCISSNLVGYTSTTIEILIPPPPQLVNSTQPEDLGDIFVTDSFQLSCQFETSLILITSLSIQWYHNNTLNTIFPNATTTNGNTSTSTLTVTASLLSQAGDYHCVATVGASSPTNSTPISVIINPITLPNAISVMITDSELRNATISWTLSIQFLSLTETYTLVYQRVGDSSYQTINTLSSTSFTVTGLLFNSQYRVYVNATNRFGTTQGPADTFNTDPVRLYFMREGEIVQFASGSIFRGGTHSTIKGGVFQFYCVPDSPDQVITWYAPNGDVIPAGPQSSGLYHIRNASTGESVLYTNNAIVSSNEGNNFTCSFTPSSGPAIEPSFGIYYVGQDNDGVFGVRLYGPGNVIYEFVYQAGNFYVDLTATFDIECLNPFNQISQWEFEPSLVSENTTTNTLITQAQFNPNATCQYISCNPSVQYAVFSDKPFFLQTSVTGAQPNCRPNNHLYEFSLGSPIELYITCPLIFGSRFLDVSGFSQIQNEFTVDISRRLFFNTLTLPTLALERNFVCVNTYGDNVSFRIGILASEAIQLLGSEDSDTPIVNGTDLIGVDIPNIIYCIIQSNDNSANWLVDANPNRTHNEPSIPVNINTAAFPYFINPRVGRSNLILNGTIESEKQGYYTCVTNPGITVGIFSQNPVPPTATISPGQTMIQVVIGTNTPVLNCGHNNSPHPLPIYFWTGSISSSTATLDTNLLLESNSGEYTCTASNVVGLSTDAVTITVIPPPPQFKSIQLVTTGSIFITDLFELSCQFETLSSVTTTFSIQWYHNEILNAISPTTTNTNGNTATSTLTVTVSSLSQAGDYHCIATVGASSLTNSTPISVIINPITLPNAIPVTITDSEMRNATISWIPSIQFPSLTETYTLVYQRVGDSSYQTINTLSSTSFTLTGLLFNSQYRVYVNATNRFGTTQGPDTIFSTDQVTRLYFMREGEIVQFASGSIFRGGIHSIIIGGVFQFYCVPDSPDQVITWYAPNGDVISSGPMLSGLYHIRNNNTGVSVLYTNNAIVSSNEGNNFTCSFTSSSGPVIESSFGIYYVGQDNDDVFGVRLSGPRNIIYEFVYQTGNFYINLTATYDIECLNPSNQISQWEFEPSLVSENTTTNTLITQAQFNPNATCQYISCNPSVQYPVFSDKPFFLQTSVTGGQPNCRPNNHLYEFSLGSPIELYITCPLIFGSRFLDVSDFSQIQNAFTVDTSRRLFFNTSARATLALERNFVCEDTYGDSVSFSIRIVANEAIQLLGSEDSDTPIMNGTDLIAGVDIPDSISCITRTSGNSANWFVNTNPNRTQNEPSIPVNTNTAAFPYFTNPRVGRSNLILNGTIGSEKQGYYTCVTNPGITVGIFSQNPVPPTATISPGQTMIQVVIGTNTPVLNCGHNNSPHPLPIYFWTGSISSSTATLDTNLFLESNSGEYTCTASNVVGLSTDAVTITVIPPPPQFKSIQLVTTGSIFVTYLFELSCQFDTLPNVTTTLSIQWYHNTLNAIAPSTTNTNGNTSTSTLTVTVSSLSQAGDYHCVATVGASSLTNSTPISVIINPITLPNAIPVTITDSEMRNVTISWTPSIQFSSLTETYTLVYQRVGDSSYQTINTLSSTSFTLTGLLFNSQYRVYVNATNRFGTTQGPDATFSTDQVARLYFMREGEIVPFASGSIFRGGTHSIIIGGVFQFYCVPDSPDQVITWYAPNGDVIPAGPIPSGVYHSRDNNTGESVLCTNNAIGSSNEGNNFTCSFTPSSGPAIKSYFGIYYVWLVLNFHDIFGVRLYGPDKVIYEFVYQIGTIDLDFAANYNIECLNPSNQANQWVFEPNLVSKNTTSNTLITQAQFNSSATCQYISCNPSVQYPVFSDKPFFLQTNVTIGQPNCRPNNHVFEFNLGSPIELYITCPLIFGSRFLDISDIEVIQNDFTVDTSRRLFFNATSNLAALNYERDYICEDVYGERVSFSIRVLSNDVIELLAGDNSDSTLTNGTKLIGGSIPNSISCITQTSGNSANWFVDSNSNRSLNGELKSVSIDTAASPYVTNPRVGRSNLILNGTIGSDNQGYYTCVTNPGITVGIFSQDPVPPNATISPGQTMIKVVIGTNTPVLNCGHNNSPHPLPIYFWTGSISSSTATLDTNLLLESNSGEYTCTASNVVGLATDAVTITVIPPPPQSVSIQLSQPNIYINYTVMLQCQFSTFPNVTSPFEIDWYKDGVVVPNTTNITMTPRDGNGNVTSTLTLSNSQINNEGDYSCEAKVGASQISVSENLTLKFDPLPTPIHLQLISTLQTPYFTQDTQLQCNFSTEPRFQSLLMIYWYHNNNTIMDNGDGIQITRTNVGRMEVESTLTLNNISYIRTGDYHCAGRVVGELSSDQINSTLFTVTVLQPPAPSLVGNIYITKEDIFLSDTFSISCQFMTLEHFFQTLEISWSLNGTTLLQNSTNTDINTVNIGNTNINSSLTITDAQMGQSGMYTCSGNVLSSTIATGNITITITAPLQTTPQTTQSTTSQTTPTTAPFDYVPIIAGGLIGVLFIIVVILVVLLILIIICRSRTKKRTKENLPDILLRRDRKRHKSSASEKQLVTPTASLGLDITYIHQQDNKNFQDDPPATTTFRGSGYQETELNTAEPLYEDFAFEKYTIPLSIFPQKVLEFHLANNAEFDRQYSTLRKTFIHDVSTGSHINNKPKNRFANIIPYEHSRVRLTYTGEHHSDYVNACYIDGYHRRQTYIASQGPMPHTVNDFWRMIWEKNIDHIIALTKVMEAAKRKCEQYWPENEMDMCEFDMIQVTLKKCERYTSYDIRMMEVTHAEYPTDVRAVIQFHYTVWPDHGVPIFSSSLISFISHTKEYNDPKRAQPPMLVHCSAGVGRTGTFIVLDYFMEQLKEDIDKVNIYRLVAQLRENRCLMVQTRDQYIFIHDALLDIICCKDTFIADHEFQAYLDNAMIRSLESMSTPFEDQYELIMKTSRIVDERDIAEASDLANIMKNRFPNFVPFDSHRVTVIPDQDGDKDYINASFVHSYQKHKGFIAAQGPLEHTIYDFWKMITKYRTQIILMLSDLSEGGHEMCAKYWPEEGQEIMVQYLIISCEKEEVFDEYIRRKLVVSTQQGGINQCIQQIQFRKWHYNEQPNVKDLMLLYHQFTQVQRAVKSKEISAILVHCDNGSTRTGSFIACINAIQQLELERRVDVFQIVRNLRNSRPCMVPSLDLYILCFKLVACYIQSYEEKAYANFM